jgi:hypothetical protein
MLFKLKTGKGGKIVLYGFSNRREIKKCKWQAKLSYLHPFWGVCFLVVVCDRTQQAGPLPSI